MNPAFRIVSRDHLEAEWGVDLGGDLIRWTVHAGPRGGKHVLEALRSAARESSFRAPADASLTDLHEDEYSSCSIELEGEAYAGFIMEPLDRIELNALPSELFRRDRSGWRSYLRLCEGLCDRTGYAGTLTSLRGEWFFLAYFPALKLWFARVQEFSVEDDFDGPGFASGDDRPPGDRAGAHALETLTRKEGAVRRPRS